MKRSFIIVLLAVIVALPFVLRPKRAAVKKADASIHSLKKQIRLMQAKRSAAIEAKDRKLATICRRKISRLRKKARRAAA